MIYLLAIAAAILFAELEHGRAMDRRKKSRFMARVMATPYRRDVDASLREAGWNLR